MYRDAIDKAQDAQADELAKLGDFSNGPAGPETLEQRRERIQSGISRLAYLKRERARQAREAQNGK